jgi:hypothetical protein
MVFAMIVNPKQKCRIRTKVEMSSFKELLSTAPSFSSLRERASSRDDRLEASRVFSLAAGAVIPGFPRSASSIFHGSAGPAYCRLRARSRRAILPLWQTGIVSLAAAVKGTQYVSRLTAKGRGTGGQVWT